MCELCKNAGKIKQEDNKKTTQEHWIKVERGGGGDQREQVPGERYRLETRWCKTPESKQARPPESLRSPSWRCGNLADCLASRRRLPYNYIFVNLSPRVL